MAKEIAIVLNDGGINSAVATALAAQRFRPVMLHVISGARNDEGQEQASRGRVAFDQQAAFFKPYRDHILQMPFLSLFTQAGGPKPVPGTTDVRQPGTLASQMQELLPLMAAAGRFAAHYQAGAIYLGLRVGNANDELAQATEYLQIWTELLQLTCGLPEVEFNAPLLELEPWQVADLGFQTSAPLERTWSCMGNGAEPCWSCRGCRAREAAFIQAAKPDPLRVPRKG